MKITCLEKQVGQLLGEAYYKIPRFQRPYSWDHVNVEEFWNDAVVESEGDYFIGNFVVYDDKDVLGVVDGQQTADDYNPAFVRSPRCLSGAR